MALVFGFGEVLHGSKLSVLNRVPPASRSSLLLDILLSAVDNVFRSDQGGYFMHNVFRNDQGDYCCLSDIWSREALLAGKHTTMWNLNESKDHGHEAQK